jgi:hypothetical protein
VTTLIGPGEVGKSTLARADADVRGPKHADGYHVLELAAHDSGIAVLPAIARAADVMLDPDRPDDAIRSIAKALIG